MTAVAAMSENRVIGCEGGIPWHLPEDFRFFKATTLGGVLVMGRKTHESIGKPLPGRETIVVSASGREYPGTRTVASLAVLKPQDFTQPVYLCGGEAIYRAGLPYCQEILLSHVAGEYEGDTHFPAFEADFAPVETLIERPEFRWVRYRAKVGNDG